MLKHKATLFYPDVCANANYVVEFTKNGNMCTHD